MAGPFGVFFDGLDYFERSDPWVGAVDSNYAIYRVIARVNSLGGGTWRSILAQGGADRTQIRLTNSDYFQVGLKQQNGNWVSRYRSDTIQSEDVWVTAVVVSNRVTREEWLYADRVLQAVFIQEDSGGLIAWSHTGAGVRIAEAWTGGGGHTFYGDLSDLTLWTDTAFDPDTHLDMLYGPAGEAKDLGPDGTATGMPAPIAHHRLANVTGSPNDYGNNGGTGGDLDIVVGSPAYSAEHPPPYYAEPSGATIVPRMPGINMGEGFLRA